MSEKVKFKKLVSDMTSGEKCLEGLITFVILTPFSLLASLYAAWLLSYCWLWFVVPLGVVKVTVLHAWGLTAICTFFATHRTSKKFEYEGELMSYCIEAIFTNFIICTMTWFTCYILHNIM